MGLDDLGYGTLRSTIAAQDNLPSLNKVHSLAVQEERMLSMRNDQKPVTDVLAFAAQRPPSRPSSGTVDKKSLFCVHCNKTGHDNSSCFKIVGYPDWWNNGRGVADPVTGAPPPRSKPVAAPDSGVGRGRGKVTTAGVNFDLTNSPSSSSSQTITATDREGFTISHKQWDRMLDMFQKFTTKSRNDTLAGPHYEDADWSG